MSAIGTELQDLFRTTPDLRVEKLKGDASTRQYLRLLFPTSAGAQQFVKTCAGLKGREAEAVSPLQDGLSSLVAMVLPGKGASRAARMVADVAGYLKRCKVPVPGIYAAVYGMGLLLIQDLGDERLFELVPNMNDQVLRDSYQRLIDQLVLMQFPPPSVPRDCVAFRYSFTAEKFLSELEFFAEHFTQVVLGREPTQGEERIMRRAFRTVCVELMTQPMLFVHRDYHARNVMVTGDTLYVIDFQDARMGPILYDIVSLLFDPYVRLSAKMRQELIDYYFSKLPPRSLTALRKMSVSRALDLCVIQRCLKAAGTYSYQAAGCENREYLRFLSPAIKHAATASKRNADLLDLTTMLEHWQEQVVNQNG